MKTSIEILGNQDNVARHFSAEMTNTPVLKSWDPCDTRTGVCQKCKSKFEFSATTKAAVVVECFSCGNHNEMAPQGQPQQPRKEGSDQNPCETDYYDLLGVPVDATQAAIKKAC